MNGLRIIVFNLNWLSQLDRLMAVFFYVLDQFLLLQISVFIFHGFCRVSGVVHLQFSVSFISYNIFSSTMQLLIAPFPSHNMFRPYMAIIGCLSFAKIVALYGTTIYFIVKRYHTHIWFEKLDVPYSATILANERHLMMAVYSRNMLWEGKGTVISCIIDGNILYEINETLQVCRVWWVNEKCEVLLFYVSQF
jgi:hypothetical protein